MTPLSTPRPSPARRDRSSVRFAITRRGTRRMIEYKQRRTYRDLLRETPHWDAPLAVTRDHDGDWIIVARLDPDLTHGRPQLAEAQLANGWFWDSEAEAQAHIEEHADELRDELVDDLFTMGVCTRCEAVVPVFGDYHPYSPAGSLVCGECLSVDGDEPAAPAILHP